MASARSMPTVLSCGEPRLCTTAHAHPFCCSLSATDGRAFFPPLPAISLAIKKIKASVDGTGFLCIVSTSPEISGIIMADSQAATLGTQVTGCSLLFSFLFLCSLYLCL